MKRLLGSIVGCAALAAGAQDLSGELATVHSMRCTFGPGTRTTWVAGHPHTVDVNLDKYIVFDSIDVAAGTANELVDLRVDPARVFRSSFGLIVMDVRSTTFEMTTIFASPAKDGTFPAANVRNLGDPVASSEQYFGSCKLQS
ncbi:MAG TPA: hypothetical protein VLY46_01320 [Usitatibacter sp.]|nr:hypothetical protein [Usitatibacter sp.]